MRPQHPGGKLPGFFAFRADRMPEQPIWGAAAIAKAIGRSESSVKMLMTAGKLPGAMQVGGKWCFFPSVFFDAAKRGNGAPA